MPEKFFIIIEITILILIIIFMISFIVVAKKHHKLNTCQIMPTACTSSTSRVLAREELKAALALKGISNPNATYDDEILG